MSPYWSKFEGPAKWLVIFATFFVIASGLCGVQASVMGALNGSSGGFTNSPAFVTAYIGLAGLEVIVILVSVVGMLVTAIVWAFQSVGKNRSGREGEALERRPESTDKTDETREP